MKEFTMYDAQMVQKYSLEGLNNINLVTLYACESENIFCTPKKLTKLYNFNNNLKI